MEGMLFHFPKKDEPANAWNEYSRIENISLDLGYKIEQGFYDQDGEYIIYGGGLKGEEEYPADEPRDFGAPYPKRFIRRLDTATKQEELPALSTELDQLEKAFADIVPTPEK
jgi:hypothetical protein